MDQLEGEKEEAGIKVAKLEGQIKQAEKCVPRDSHVMNISMLGRFACAPSDQIKPPARLAGPTHIPPYTPTHQRTDRPKTGSATPSRRTWRTWRRA
jgi:hypothetical protein